MHSFHKISIALLVTCTIPLFVRTRTLTYYWLLIRSKYLRSKNSNKPNKRSTMISEDFESKSFMS